jgi:hypothetical protein
VIESITVFADFRRSSDNGQVGVFMNSESFPRKGLRTGRDVMKADHPIKSRSALVAKEFRLISAIRPIILRTIGEPESPSGTSHCLAGNFSASFGSLLVWPGCRLERIPAH